MGRRKFGPRVQCDTTGQRRLSRAGARAGGLECVSPNTSTTKILTQGCGLQKQQTARGWASALIPLPPPPTPGGHSGLLASSPGQPSSRPTQALGLGIQVSASCRAQGEQHPSVLSESARRPRGLLRPCPALAEMPTSAHTHQPGLVPRLSWVASAASTP